MTAADSNVVKRAKRSVMRQKFEVVYENGVLRPLEPLPAAIREHQQLTVIVEEPDLAALLDFECVAAAARESTSAATLDDVRRILSKVPVPLSEVIAAEREER
jgi:predicted DNA-binding antitoxin AbrB/MazE fold protein